MFNIYTFIKNQNKENENKKFNINKSNNLKKDKIKREKLSKKYEERIRNFIYQLFNNNDYSNISIKTKNPLVDLLNNQNEKNKKYQDFINEKILIKKIYKNLYDKKKSRNKFSYNSDINDINNKTTVNILNIHHLIILIIIKYLIKKI